MEHTNIKVFYNVTGMWEWDVLVVFNENISLHKGKKKPTLSIKRKNALYLLMQTVSLFLAVTKDMTGHIAQGPRFMRSRFVSGR